MMLACLLAPAVAVAAQVRLMDTGPGYVLVEYQAAAGENVLTSRAAALIGIPLNAEPRLEVLSVSSRIVPDREWTSPEERDAQLPGPAAINRIGFVRDQRVAELAFMPRPESDGTCEVFERVVARVSFERSPTGSAPAGSGRWGERYLRNAVLNYRQARSWRLPRSRPARGPAGTQEAGVLQPGTRSGAGPGVSVPGDDQQTAAVPARGKAMPTGAASTSDLLRVRVREEGMYRLTGADLEAAGVVLDQVEAAALTLYYGGGRPLEPESAGVVWREMPLLVAAGDDGRFDADDYVLFYGVGPSRWEYSAADSAKRYLHNLYTHDNVYWLGVGGQKEGVRGAVRPSAAAADTVVSAYRERVHEEFEQYIAVQTESISSGYEWYWENFTGNARNYPVLIRDAVDAPVDITLGFQGVSGKRATFSVRWNDAEVAAVSVPGLGYSQHSVQVPGGVQEGANQLGLFHTNAAPMRLDWYELEYSRELVAERGELRFDAPSGAGVAEYRLSGFGEARPRVFQVEPELAEIVDFAYDASAGTVVFRAQATDPPRRYVVLVPARLRRPAGIELDGQPGSLREDGVDAEYLIITHADFRSSAERLAAWRAQDDRFGAPLSTRVVDVQEIYDEFSGGLLDPTAIRAFLRYAYHHWSTPPFFVLLLGDGTYDYKNNSGVSAGNWVPAYQEDESTYDEWYVSVAGDDILPDMAIGRIPVQTPADAALVVDRLIDYDREPEWGAWQSRGLLIADDLRNPDAPASVETMFLMDAEYMARDLLPKDLNLRKLYLAQYPLEGRTKPRAQAEFLKRFNQGALYVTYLGHSNVDVLAHERMFVVSRDLAEIRNGRRLPLFYTATCQVGAFDDPMKLSMPEALLVHPEGGVMGMISATRLGYHASNMTLAYAFHRLLFRGEQRHVPLGAALMQAKHMVQAGTQNPARINIRRYSLFGDPAQYLALPRNQVAVTVPDTMRALGEVRIQGQVLDPAGEPLPGFQGQAWVQAFDSSVDSELDGLLYNQLGVELFRGVYPVRNGRLEAVFRVPKDITYRGTDGRVSAYVWNDSAPAAFGAARNLVLAGTEAGVELDRVGPVIELGFAGQDGFVSGDAVPPGARVRAVISDPSGINVTGETGHEIELSVDNQEFVVTEEFAVEGDYRQGALEYALPMLEPGPHEIRLKAWDGYNNSSEAQITAQVSNRDEVVLTDLLFYPSPLTGGSGHFTFNLAMTGNRARIRVFALSGRLVDEVRSEVQAGYNQVAWEPDAALANGTYPYHIQIERQNGARVQRTSVLQLMR